MFIFQDKDAEPVFYYNLCALWMTYFALIAPTVGEFWIILTTGITAVTSILSAATIINLYKLYQQRSYTFVICEGIVTAVAATKILDELPEIDSLSDADIIISEFDDSSISDNNQSTQ